MTPSREPEARRRARESWRLETLRGIGQSDKPRCKCCGERRLWTLTIDHIHGGGRLHRESKRAATYELVRREWREAGLVWPTHKYQVLCAICNHGRNISKENICPHQYERALVMSIKKGVGMITDETKAMLGTLIRVTVAAMLAQFIAQGADVFAIDSTGLRALVSSGIAAAALTAFNWLNPGDDRYGR